MSLCHAALSGRNRFLVADHCHPQTIEVVRTRAKQLGIEVAVGGPWSIKAEYLYYDLGNRQLSAPAFFPPSPVPTAPFLWDTKTTGNIARVGINYHF